MKTNDAASENLKCIAVEVKKCSARFNELVKELIKAEVDVKFYLNGKPLAEGVFGYDFEVRMFLPQEPIEL